MDCAVVVPVGGDDIKALRQQVSDLRLQEEGLDQYEQDQPYPATSTVAVCTTCTISSAAAGRR